MPLYDKLLKKQDQLLPQEQETSPTEDLSMFKKFNDAQTPQVNTDLNVANTFKNVYQGAQDLRSQALDKIAQATNFSKDIQGADVSDYEKNAKIGLDLIAPEVTDLLPMGKLMAAAPVLGMAAKKLGKEVKAGEKVRETADEMIERIKKLNPKDFTKQALNAGKESGNLDNKFGKLEVIPTKADEVMAKGHGKIFTPDIGNQVTHNEIMKTLESSETWNNLLKDRNLFKNDPKSYDLQKNELIKKAREYLQQKQK
jgi:hypothetical protein